MSAASAPSAPSRTEDCSKRSVAASTSPRSRQLSARSGCRRETVLLRTYRPARLRPHGVTPPIGNNAKDLDKHRRSHPPVFAWFTLIRRAGSLSYFGRCRVARIFSYTSRACHGATLIICGSASTDITSAPTSTCKVAAHRSPISFNSMAS